MFIYSANFVWAQPPNQKSVVFLKMQCQKLEGHSLEHTTQWLPIKTKLLFSEVMVELITIEQHLMTFISLIWILTNGESQKQKEILHNLEEAILQVYLLTRTKCLLLEDGTLFCSFQICLFIILRLKLGSSRRCYNWNSQMEF